MTNFPVNYKPAFPIDPLPAAIEYKNVIDKSIADEIISLAKNYDGWHRRGSKSSFIDASFTTTLLHDMSHPIYSIMDELWKKATIDYDINLDFVEVYEIKEYLIGDKFDPHNDTHDRLDVSINRKLNVILQLSEEEAYEGGELHIKDFVATKSLGSAIFFPAHYRHWVTEVTAGTRYSLIGHGWGNINRR